MTEMPGMTGPTWLAAIVGVLMLAAAGYAVARIVLAWRTGRATDYSIELCHAVMGVSMAGMLIPGLGLIRSDASVWVWVIGAAVIALWFLLRVADELTKPAARLAEGQRRRVHHLPHLVLAGAMLYMLVAMYVPFGASPSSTDGMDMNADMDMHMHMSTGAGSNETGMPWPTLDLLLAFFLIGYLILLIDRLPAIAQLGGIGQPQTLGRRSATPAPLYAPRASAVLALTMSAGMAYMLVMMFV